MYKRLKNIVLGFENVEVIDIPACHVQCFELKNIIENRFKEWNGDLVVCSKKAESATIVLNPKANVELENPWGDHKTVFGRIQAYDDLSDIEIFYDDGTSETVAFVWGEDDCTNRHQSSATTNNGYLMIAIGKDRTAEGEIERLFRFRQKE